MTGRFDITSYVRGNINLSVGRSYFVNKKTYYLTTTTIMNSLSYIAQTLKCYIATVQNKKGSNIQ